jgi:tRNA1(Val) A37 N6-methylase TrmN6
MMHLYQANDGYRYNSDTLLLYDFIAAFSPKGMLLDVGCGCGILGLLIKRDFPELKLHLIDIQEQNCRLSEANAKHNGIEIKSLTCKDFLQARFEQKMDWIISNPPFYHHGVMKSQNASLFLSRHSSALPFEAFALKVTKSLSNRGYFCFCYDAKQLDILMNGLLHAKLNVEDICFVHSRKDNEASLVLIKARKNSKTLCKVHPPIFIYENEHFSARVQGIFEKSQTKSLEWQN